MEDDEYLRCHFYRKIGLMLLWAKITSIREAEAESQKLIVYSLIAAQNGSNLRTLTACVTGTSESVLIFNVFIILITLARVSTFYRW